MFGASAESIPDRLLDVALKHEFWGSIKDAEGAAFKEAANTGAAIVAVKAIDIEAHRVSFVGVISESAIDGASSAEGGDTCLGTFHTTWGAVLNPAQDLGFLVVRHPVKLRFHSDGTDE